MAASTKLILLLCLGALVMDVHGRSLKLRSSDDMSGSRSSDDGSGSSNSNSNSNSNSEDSADNSSGEDSSNDSAGEDSSDNGGTPAVIGPAVPAPAGLEPTVGTTEPRETVTAPIVDDKDAITGRVASNPEI